MFQYHPDVLRKRQTLDGLSGSVIVTNTSPTATALIQNTTPVPGSGSQTGIQLASSTPSASPTSSSASSAVTTSPSSSSEHDISLGTVIGACVGAFILLVLVIFLAIHCSRRQKPQRRGKASPTSQPHSADNLYRRRFHSQSWERLNDDKVGHLDGSPRPPSGPMEKLGAMFHRTPSTTSGEKTSESHGNRESIGTMQHFARYHPGLAEEMASKSADLGRTVVTKPLPVQRLMGRPQADGVPTISWDGDTVGGDSFFSVHSRLSGTMSPTMTMVKFTPPATVSGSHRWESAEVGHIDAYGSEMSEAGDSRNPFADAASVKSGISRRVTNPFFNAQEKSQKRALLPNATTESNPFADSNAPVPRLEARPNNNATNNSHAMQSLIAALDMSAEAGLSVSSMRLSNYSRSSTIMSCDEVDAVSVTAFPYPPTQVPLR
ncbi:uncharacterized protein EDB93DRAFT_862915 [Suillus bovinus]|uniref:uncharacterized protein n=1 Tax=Suillus bovinus TaxID=48563 RepID=UPI001B8738AC|nr:uncharacterized protein EDB93DRAFT_862915 [Suillus bovinus]KAG2133680.1 hypothetical protein EDB93DRAFT_862915 [Suillus bovinus]